MEYFLFLQVIHVVAGTVWLCGFIFFYLVLIPVLIKKDFPGANQLLSDLKRQTSIILGSAGVISITLGFVRGLLWGNLTSIDAIFTTYGKFFLFAILLSVVLIFFGKVYGRHLEKIIRKKETTAKQSVIPIYFYGFLFLFCYAALIYCMISMRYAGM